MKIKSLKLSKLYSFGHLQEFSGFSDYNLFIGPNGSGKTNVLRILAGLPYEFARVGDLPAGTQTQSGESLAKPVTVFKPDLFGAFNSIINDDAKMSDIAGYLEVNYETISNVSQTSPEKKRITCSDGPHQIIEFNSGDIVEYSRRISHVTLPENDYEFFKDLSIFAQSSDRNLDLLNFGMFYIFGLYYSFMKDGRFIQGKKARGGSVEHDYRTLPSGVRQVAKLLVRIIAAQDQPVLLIDEPELHIEPRHLRSLFEFIIWYCCMSKDTVSQSEARVRDKVDHVVSASVGNPMIAEIPSKFGNTLHGKQIFVSSHSSVLINEFLRIHDVSSLYEFSLVEDTVQKKLRVPAHLGFEAPTSEVKTVFSNVRKVDAHTSAILEALGCKGSDLLQCNGVVWVEGPSDVVYLNKWLDLYAAENGLSRTRQGEHFEFQMYGGALLDSLCLIKSDSDENEERRKLVEMFSFSRNAFIVMDSDAVRTDPNTVRDQSTFFTAKNFIKKQASQLNTQGYQIGLWYAEGDTTLRTIEDYLDDLSLQTRGPTKKITAQKRVAQWEQKKLSDFPEPLALEIEKLYNHILAWQN